VRVTLIHNPGAGAQADGDAQKLIELLHDAGHEVRYQSAKDDDWEKALDWPADVVAVAGGDGTVARVAKRIVGRKLPIAALPSGTANNIARTLGLVDRPFEELVRAWPEARRVKLDIGVAKGPWGERYFIEGVGTGLFATLLSTRNAKRKTLDRKHPEKRVTGALEMLKDLTSRCPPIEMNVALDGRDISGRYLLFETMNIPYVGPNLFLAPDSQPGDGTFDVVVVTEAERDRLTHYLESWQTNRERLSVLPSYRGKHVQMEWDGFELHIDDDLWPEDDKKNRPERATIDLRIAASVQFLAPDPKKAQ
jgi:diacylglycerol kinase family enzyme